MIFEDQLSGVLIFALTVSFGAVVSPGPVSAAIINESPRQGWRAGPLIASGHTFLELVMVILISLGITAGLNTPAAQRIISFIGGLVLAAIGLSYVLSAWRGTVSLQQIDRQSTLKSHFPLIGLGMLTTLSNPFWYAWWLTVAAGYLVHVQIAGVSALIVFYVGHITVDFGWDTTLSITTSAGRRWLTTRRYRLLIMLTGGFMLYLAGLFLYKALQSVL